MHECNRAPAHRRMQGHRIARPSGRDQRQIPHHPQRRPERGVHEIAVLRSLEIVAPRARGTPLQCLTNALAEVPALRVPIPQDVQRRDGAASQGGPGVWGHRRVMQHRRFEQSGKQLTCDEGRGAPVGMAPDAQTVGVHLRGEISGERVLCLGFCGEMRVRQLPQHGLGHGHHLLRALRRPRAATVEFQRLRPGPRVRGFGDGVRRTAVRVLDGQDHAAHRGHGPQGVAAHVCIAALAMAVDKHRPAFAPCGGDEGVQCQARDSDDLPQTVLSRCCAALVWGCRGTARLHAYTLSPLHCTPSAALQLTLMWTCKILSKTF